MIKEGAMIINTKKRIFVMLFCCVFACPVALASISSRVKSIVSRKNLKNVDFGIVIADASDGGVYFEKNPHTPRIPASNMKVVTSAAALKILGADYQFKTAIALHGDTLVIIGGGDPLFGDSINDEKNGRKENWIFADIIKTLKARGLRSVSGIVVDSTFFDNCRVHPNWSPDELNRAYACEVSGLNFNQNCVSINVKRSGSAARVSITPSTSYIQIVNKVTLKSSGNSAVGAYRNGVPNKYILKGKCRKEAGFDVAIEGPAMFFGVVLSERLKAAGIKVAGSVSEKYIKNAPGIEIMKVYKTPLTDVLARCNKDSFNMAAESLVKTISAENTNGKINGEWQHGFSLIGRYLKQLKVESEQYNLDDGCGLSRQNKLSADAIAKVLFDVYHGDNRQLYIDTLAVGGVEGTTAKYFRESKYKGRIFAKTGYINGVRAFSGYVKTENGDYIFSILTQRGQSHVRAAINDIVKAIFK
jgi:D-alanyl-D-alanine carboxypeptidase/D-alanyl-D-alanine-endopeptidase (penicillin-binding protein 4)